jgi:nitrite reductase/ring-hydroxylating ferredoxin subunit
LANSSDNPARPEAGVRLCALGELADPGSKGFRFRVDRTLFAAFLVRSGDRILGYVDSCPHAGWPLGFDDRYLTRNGEHILCAGHGALFSLDGKGVTAPCVGERLTAWPVAVRDGEVFTA